MRKNGVAAVLLSLLLAVLMGICAVDAQAHGPRDEASTLPASGAPSGLPSGTDATAPSAGPSASVTANPSANPTANPTASPSESPQASPSAAPLPPLKVTKLWAGDEAGFPRKTFWSVETAVYFYALVAPRTAARKGPPRAAEERAFTITVRDAMGRDVARLGGPLPSTLDPTRADLPRDCAGEPGNGLAIADTPLAEKPGRYHAVAFMDGVPAGDLWFVIKRLRNDGQVTVTSAAVEDAQGMRRFTFTSRDRGVYAHVTLVNNTRTAPHEHLVQVAFVGPHGQVGRFLGGTVHLEKGARLDGRDFPVLNDPEHADGLLVDGTPVARLVGAWKMVVHIDGKPVREVPFRLVP